jgi:hypothetical protein
MAYVQLVDGIGRYTLTIEVRDLRDDVLLARMPSVLIEFSDRISKTALAMIMTPVRIPHPGLFDFVILADDDEIERQKFEAVYAKSTPNEGQGDDSRQE